MPRELWVGRQSSLKDRSLRSTKSSRTRFCAATPRTSRSVAPTVPDRAHQAVPAHNRHSTLLRELATARGMPDLLKSVVQSEPAPLQTTAPADTRSLTLRRGSCFSFSRSLPYFLLGEISNPLHFFIAAFRHSSIQAASLSLRRNARILKISSEIPNVSANVLRFSILVRLSPW